MRYLQRTITLITLLLLFTATGIAVEASIQPSNPDDITLDADNGYEVSKEFDGTASTGDIKSYQWNLVDSSHSASGTTATFTFDRDSSASNTIRLTVTNDTGSDIDEVTQVLHDVPEVSIDPSSSQSANKGDTLDFTSSVTNSFDGPVSYSWTVDGTEESTSKDFSKTFSTTGTSTVKVTVTDNVGNTASQSVDVDVSQSSSSSPSNNNPGGSSGGNIDTGGQAGQPNHTATFSNVSSGASVTVNVEKSEQIGVNSVFIQVNNPAKEITVTVTKQDGKPADVEQDVEGKKYRYMDIEEEGINESGIETSVVRFSVNTSWIQENNIDPNRVFLNRYANGQWNRLSTDKMVETSSKVVYEAETPGFSYFAVSSDEQQEQQETEQNDSEQTSSTCGDGICASGETAANCPQDCETQQEESTEENTTDTDSSTNTGNKLGVSKSTAILAVLIIIAVGLAYYWHRQGKENAEEPQ